MTILQKARPVSADDADQPGGIWIANEVEKPDDFSKTALEREVVVDQEKEGGDDDDDDDDEEASDHNDSAAFAAQEDSHSDSNNVLEAEDFPKHGVSLSFLLHEFVNDVVGGREKLQCLTTTDVCEQINKPKTTTNLTSYCQLLKDQNHPAYGATGCVVCFSRPSILYEFLTVLSALE